MRLIKGRTPPPPRAELDPALRDTLHATITGLRAVHDRIGELPDTEVLGLVGVFAEVANKLGREVNRRGLGNLPLPEDQP